MKAFSGLVEILAAVAVMFLYPVISMAQKQSVIEELLLRTRTEQFADQIRTHGYLSLEEYEKFQRFYQSFEITGGIELETVGNRYDSQIGSLYDVIATNEELTGELEEKGMIRFCQGDSLKITVSGSFKGTGRILRGVYGAAEILIETGGVIRDEIEPIYPALP